ncbi:YybH family protein [Arenimonas oryziterrae]|uniref:Uncharacterized protein n=1 Tax=Arenimonas oryziterrae DSM 21050 = YC6267 TaxID=1121015 RepID=A0A091AQY4_9GAMM|nr:nuclear transport factor 2 family protein [Arenimonas oryziterrae]KFN42583.1 hypothetical protein N789_13160 [Arenimonas oryziterrae DSM 21050 = YC6267]
MKKLFCSVFLALLPLTAFANTPTPEREAGIRQVIESFRTAIIDKDKDRFLALFAPGTVSWQSVNSDATVQRYRVKNPTLGKVRSNPGHNPLSFIDNIVADKESTEETFNNIRIDSDGDVAAVSFDYVFIGNGVASNYGQESWQLVRTEDGWRIVSVIWSVNVPEKKGDGR